MFSTGGTALQTQANAAENGGCGLILVPEMKSGKGRYTNIDGSYGPLLDFYEESMQGKSYRKADNIATVQKCRIHLLTAGVKNDWVDFVSKSGASSGTLGRVIPVITFDRTMIRILSERMPIYTFPLTGIKKIFTILEGKFRKVNSNCEEPPIILEFSSSYLMDNYRKTNNLLVQNYNGEQNRNLRKTISILLDNPPPDADSLLAEGRGIGEVNCFFYLILILNSVDYERVLVISYFHWL